MNELLEIVPVSVSSEADTPVQDVSEQWNTGIPETDTSATITITVNGCSVEIKSNTMKALYFDCDGFVLLQKRLDNGKFQWLRNSSEVCPLTIKEFRWLMEGLSIDQPKAIQPAKDQELCDWTESFLIPHIRGRAGASAVMYSIVENAKANHLNISSIFIRYSCICRIT